MYSIYVQYLLMIKSTIKKSLAISLFLSLTSIQIASANIFSSTSIEAGMNSIGLKIIDDNSMYLGEWRHQISAKLNPSYFNQLDRLKSVSALSQNSQNLITNFNSTSSHFSVPAFSDSLFNELYNGSEIFFSFSSKNIKLNPHSLSELLSSFGSQPLSKKSNAKLIEQEFYAPGYVYSKGNSSIGVGVLLVQQKFLDNSFGSVTLGNSSGSNAYYDSSLLNINKGTGYQFNVSQKLTNRIDVSLDYQSEVLMNEFDSSGRSYSDPGDFDIPSQYTLSVGMNVFETSKISFTAEEIAFSNVDPFVHSGYSQSFLNAYNSPISPLFKLDDLTVYSISFNQEINDRLTWNMDITSRQQAPATAITFNRILNNDTASVSYKLGVSYASGFGQLDLFTSFANKPLLIGGTDFGRSANNVLSNHFEGVASWSFQF
jgi:hypothetical protein